MKRAAGIASAVLLSAATMWADTVALFYALDPDMAAARQEAGVESRVTTVGSRSIHRFRLGDHDVVAVRMGSGCVETAASAQALLTRFRCDRAISIGPAGALSDAVTPGHWYRVGGIVAWQRGASGTEGFRLSENATWNLPDNSTVGESPKPFPAAEVLSLASGESFVASDEARSSVRSLTGADLVDMNSFGLALVCEDHRVPLHIWRIASDLADGNAAETFRRFIEAYDGEGGREVVRWIRGLPSGTNAAPAYPEIRRLMESIEGSP